MVEADKPTTVVANSEVIQDDDKARRSCLFKSVGNLSLAATKVKPEQPQAMGGGSRGESTAGLHES